MCGAKRRIWSIILPRRKLSILSKNLKALVRFTKIDFFLIVSGFSGKEREDRAAEKTRDIEWHVQLTVNGRWLSY